MMRSLFPRSASAALSATLVGATLVAALAATPAAGVAQASSDTSRRTPADGMPRTGRPAVAITLPDAVALAQRQGPAARAAESAREAVRWETRAFNARLMPQFVLSGNAPQYQHTIVPVTQIDEEGNATREFVPVRYMQSEVLLNVVQQIPQTGTQVVFSSGLTRFDQSGRASQREWQSTPFAVALRQDLFRPRTLHWERRTQDLDAEIAERRWLESREELAVAVTDQFFAAYAARVAVDNAFSNVAVNDTLYVLNKGRFEVGRIGENDLLQSELALLRARATLDGARLDEQRAMAALRLQLDLPADAELALVPPDVLPPAVRIDTAEAARVAMRNLSRLKELERRETVARRDVTTARLRNGFNATIDVSAGYNQQAPVFGDAYRELLDRQTATVAVAVPLWQWGGGRADVQAASALREQVRYETRLARDQVAQDARFGALQFAQSERLLALAAKSDTVATKRFDVAKNRYVVGRINITDLYLAQTEKDASRAGYVQALRAYWTAYYRLRRLTLYDFATNAELRAGNREQGSGSR